MEGELDGENDLKEQEQRSSSSKMNNLGREKANESIKFGTKFRPKVFVLSALLLIHLGRPEVGGQQVSYGAGELQAVEGARARDRLMGHVCNGNIWRGHLRAPATWHALMVGAGRHSRGPVIRANRRHEIRIKVSSHLLIERQTLQLSTC